jgi:endothelin-converting enzyme/putative endopeptidase
MNEEESYEFGKILLDQMIQKIKNIETPEDFAIAVADLQSMSVNVFFGFSIDQDVKNATQMIPDFSSGGMGLPEKSYYTDSSPEGQSLLAQYKQHIANMLKLSGVYSTKQSLISSSKVLAIESHLANYSLAADEQRDPVKLYNPKSWNEFTALNPKFHWEAFFTRIDLNSVVGNTKQKINVTETNFYQGLSLLLNKTKLTDLKDYLIWKTLSKTAALTSKSLNDENFNFYGKVLYGQTTQSPRWKTCLKQVNAHLGEALGEAFIQVAFGKEAKGLVLQMTGQIIEEMRMTVANLDWLDESTKSGANKKLDTLVRKIGYPDQFKNYDTLLVMKHSYFENWIHANRFEFRFMINTLGKPVDRSIWGMNPQTNNAYYNPTLNEIVFPAGILQTPLFNINSNDAANIGATGATIGHELTHAFDDEGRQFDENGNLHNWWSNQVENSFKEKSQCLIDQYSNYSIVGNQDPSQPQLPDGPKLHINGKLTLGENIADLGGLKLALKAFLKNHPNTFSEQNHPDAFSEPNYTLAQIFFISYAQSWCGKTTFESLKNQITSDPHSPAEFRVNGVVVNLSEFSQAFQCQQGSAMNPINKCSIW